MKKITLFKLTLLTLVSLFLSCSKTEDIETLPFESYRYDLWKNLIDNNKSFDFIGGEVDNYYYPDYLGQSFDRDHQGIGGIETEGVFVDLILSRSVNRKEVVLLGIGINDLFRGDSPQTIMKNILRIMRNLKRNNPNVIIFIEKIAPLHSVMMTDDFRAKTIALNNLIDATANNFFEDNSTIVAVDMYTDFLDIYTDDGIHYNTLGAKFIADQYMEAISEHFLDDSYLYIMPLGDSRVSGYRPE